MFWEWQKEGLGVKVRWQVAKRIKMWWVIQKDKEGIGGARETSRLLIPPQPAFSLPPSPSRPCVFTWLQSLCKEQRSTVGRQPSIKGLTPAFWFFCDLNHYVHLHLGTNPRGKRNPQGKQDEEGTPQSTHCHPNQSRMELPGGDNLLSNPRPLRHQWMNEVFLLKLATPQVNVSFTFAFYMGVQINIL